ncbi:hypothetical protein MRB53_038841 [Persea americana]|nr:hypothetical protein MRB53_038841 [Persea americana]
MQAYRSLARSAPYARQFSSTAPRALAKMQLIGRLADTPEVIPTATGRELVKYALGVSYGPKGEDGNRAVSWFRVTSFAEGPRKDFLANLPKGSLLYVETNAKMDTYEVDGQKRSSLSLTESNFEVLSRPRPVSDDVDAAQDPASGVADGLYSDTFSTQYREIYVSYESTPSVYIWSWQILAEFNHVDLYRLARDQMIYVDLSITKRDANASMPYILGSENFSCSSGLAIGEHRNTYYMTYRKLEHN